VHPILGLSEETTCYVAMDYFRAQKRFDDYVVHEAAHLFHNCKRKTIGIRETRRREWPLDIDYIKRETFAYACEAEAVEKLRWVISGTPWWLQDRSST
jgi:hypothetical protein